MSLCGLQNLFTIWPSIEKNLLIPDLNPRWSQSQDELQIYILKQALSLANWLAPKQPLGTWSSNVCFSKTSINRGSLTKETNIADSFCTKIYSTLKSAQYCEARCSRGLRRRERTWNPWSFRISHRSRNKEVSLAVVLEGTGSRQGELNPHLTSPSRAAVRAPWRPV